MSLTLTITGALLLSTIFLILALKKNSELKKEKKQSQKDLKKINEVQKKISEVNASTEKPQYIPPPNSDDSAARIDALNKL